MIQLVARRWADASDETSRGIFGSSDFAADFSHSMRKSLAPGPHLDGQNERMGRRVLLHVNDLVVGGQQINLLEWARHALTQASSCGVYGTTHPFVDVGTLELNKPSGKFPHLGTSTR